MSTQHGPIIIKPIKEVAEYIKNQIPANIPENYALKPMFIKIASEDNIRKGIIAFRDFLYLFCDCLTSDGDLFAKPPKKPTSMADYPFLFNATNLLVEIGYHSKLVKNGDSLSIKVIPSCTASTDSKGKLINPKISASNLMECLRFLTLCGFIFTGIDLEAKSLKNPEKLLIEVAYPKNPILLIGLKSMSIAEIELRTTRRYWNDNNLLRCDYRLLKAEDSDMRDVLIDFLHPLPVKVQKFALKLHQSNIEMGLTCINTRLGLASFAYAYIGKNKRTLAERDIYSKRVWEFSYSIKDGYCLFVRPQKTDKYADVIEKFPLSLQEKIAKGYGCDRKLRNEPCQHGCQGIRIPLDNSILDISKDIEIWLENEVSNIIKK